MRLKIVYFTVFIWCYRFYIVTRFQCLLLIMFVVPRTQCTAFPLSFCTQVNYNYLILSVHRQGSVFPTAISRPINTHIISPQTPLFDMQHTVLYNLLTIQYNSRIWNNGNKIALKYINCIQYNQTCNNMNARISYLKVSINT